MKPTVKITRIAKTRASNHLNKDVVKGLLKISEYDYFWTKADLGILFIKNQFPELATSEYYDYATSDSFFWAWWNLQWANWEAELLPVLIEHNIMQHIGLWKLEMKQLLFDSNAHHSFHHNYIKKSKIYEA